MRGSIIILVCFIAGVCLSRIGAVPSYFIENDYSVYALYVLIFCVGITIGADSTIFGALKRMGRRVLLLPVATIVGTLVGSMIVGLFLPQYGIIKSMAVGSGLGYYSLSSIILADAYGPELGTVALVSNIVREIITLLFAPFLVLVFGKFALISAGGATTADTTLPVITRVSGKEFVVLSIFHGIVVDLSVPILLELLTI